MVDIDAVTPEQSTESDIKSENEKTRDLDFMDILGDGSVTKRVRIYFTYHKHQSF